MEFDQNRESSSFFLILFLTLVLHIASFTSMSGQGSWYWNQTLNTEAALLSGVVVAGESGIAAIYYNPATITEMASTNLSLSANLFSLSSFEADNALGADFPADRL